MTEGISIKVAGVGVGIIYNNGMQCLTIAIHPIIMSCIFKYTAMMTRRNIANLQYTAS